jgi:Zn finger protein HypA/HybF involved in hydrogenase expression
MLHVLVSENQLLSDIIRSAKRGKAITWIVPRVAAVGDDAAIFVPDRGFVARGRVATPPEPTVFGRGPAYRAQIGRLRLFGRPVTLARVIAAAPAWKWPTYPRSRASVPQSMAPRLLRLFDSARPGAVVGLDPLTDVPPAIEGIARETRVLVRGRSDRLRRLALERSRGICSVCATDFTALLDGRAVRILHVHHRTQLSLTKQPRTTRIADLVVVCPNCHAMLHLDPGRTADIDALKLSLGSTQRSSASNKRMEPSRGGSRPRAAHS